MGLSHLTMAAKTCSCITRASTRLEDFEWRPEVEFEIVDGPKGKQAGKVRALVEETATREKGRK